MMMKYEMKKIWSKPSNKVAFIIMIGILFVACITTTTEYAFVNEKGMDEKGHSAIVKLREAKEEWNGVLDQEKIASVIAENNRIDQTKEGQSEVITDMNIAYGWKQGIEDIRELLNMSFADGFREFDYYKADTLQESQAENFYSNRVKLLKNWLDGEAKNVYSEGEKAYLIHQYETLKQPITYKYMEGWEQLFSYAPMLLMITMLVLGYFIAGIFSDEFHYKTDAIYFSSYYGRNKAITAKIKAGIFLTSMIYFGTFLLFSLFVLSYFGFGGAFCEIQAYDEMWKSMYHLTNIQEFLLICFGGYVGFLFTSLLVMAVSAITKNTIVATLIPFISIFVPALFADTKIQWLAKFLELLPEKLLEMKTTLKVFQLYQLFGHVFSALIVLFVIYIILSLVLQPITYFAYKKAE